LFGLEFFVLQITHAYLVVGIEVINYHPRCIEELPILLCFQYPHILRPL